MTIVASALMEGALIYVVAGRYVAGAGGVGNAFAFAWGKLLYLIGARIVVSVILLAIGAVGFGLFLALRLGAGLSGLGGLLLAVSFGFIIYLGTLWIFVGQTVLLENCGPISAFLRSAVHVRKHWWRVFGIMLLVALIFGFIALILHLILMFTLREAGVVIVQILTLPVSTIIVTLLYFDIRVRKEGYESGDLAKALGIGTTGEVA